MRTTGSAPVFQVPRRNAPSQKVWVAILLCALVPPLGLVVVWRGLRCPVRGKVLVSVVALLSLTLMLYAYINYQQNSGILIPQQAVGQFAVNDYTSATDAAVVATPAATGAVTADTPAPSEPEVTPAPANPFG